jgi:hypothetical protein
MFKILSLHLFSLNIPLTLPSPLGGEGERIKKLENKLPKGATQNEKDPRKDDQENSLLAVLDEVSHLPGTLLIRITLRSGKIFRDLLIVILILASETILQPVSLHLFLIRNVMEAKHEEGRCQKINIIRHDAETCRDENRTDVEGILDISVRARHGQNFVLLKMACRPDPNALPQEDQKHSDQDFIEFGICVCVIHQ